LVLALGVDFPQGGDVGVVPLIGGVDFSNLLVSEEGLVLLAKHVYIHLSVVTGQLQDDLEVLVVHHCEQMVLLLRNFALEKVDELNGRWPLTELQGSLGVADVVNQAQADVLG